MMSLTVVIPAFNAAATVRQSIDSVRLIGSVEIVVVDDGSSDQTASIAESAGAVVVSQANAGAARARMAGLRRSSSSAVVFLDADDSLVAEGVRSALASLAERADVAAVAGGVEAIARDGGVKRLSPWPRIDTLTLLRQGYSPVPPAAVVWRREAVMRAMGPAPAPLWPRFAEDYELLLRVSLFGSIHPQSELTARYRMSGGKSERHPIDAAQCAIDIAAHYSAITGIRIRRRARGGARAQAAIRLATTGPGGMRSPRGLRLLARAVLRDPAYVSSWLARGVGRRLRSVGRGRSAATTS